MVCATTTDFFSPISSFLLFSRFSFLRLAYIYVGRMVASMKDTGRRTTDTGTGCTDGRTEEYSKANLRKTDFWAKLK